MKANEFTLLASELGLTAYGPRLCGIIDGWPLTVYNARLTHVQFVADRKKDRAAMRQIEEMLKTWGGRVYGWRGNILTLSAPSQKKARGGRAEYIRFCAWAMTRAGLKPLDRCPYCGARYCDTAAQTGSEYRLVHYRCLRSAAENARGKAENGAQNGSYLLGLIGAVLGMLVGTVPTFLTVWFLSMESSLLFALIPICTYLGYKLFGGPMNRSALVISIILSVFAVFFLNLEWLIFALMDEYDLGFGEVVAIMPEVLADGSFWAETAVSSLQEYLFTALGIWIAWRYISVTDAGSADELAAALRMAKAYEWDLESAGKANTEQE